MTLVGGVDPADAAPAAARLQAAADGQTLGRVAGYAVLGGIFFLVSAVRLTVAGKGN